MSVPLWTRRGDGAGDGRRARRRAAGRHHRASRSTAAASRRAKRSSPSPATTATATTSWPAALAAGAALAVVAADRRARFPARRAASPRPRRAGGPARSGAGGARALAAQDHRRHRLGRQDRHQGGAAARAARRRRDPCLGRLLQQPLGRAAVARALPASARYAVFEIGHEPCRRDRRRSPRWCARMWRSSPRSSRCIWNSSARSRRSPTPRPRFSSGSSPAEPPSSTATMRNSPACATHAKDAGVGRIVSLRRACAGRRAADQVRRCSPDCSTVQARILGTDVTYKLGAPGRHRRAQFARGAGGGLARRRRSRAGGARAAAVAAAERPRRAHHARYPRRRGAADRRKLQRQSGLDAGGARLARPGRDRAARPAHRGARRHAGARPRGADLHRAAARAGASPTASTWCSAAGRSCAPCGRPFPPSAGAAMPRPPRLWNRKCSPPSARATPSWSKARSAPGWGRIVKALERRYSAPRGIAQRLLRKADPMLYWLSDFSDNVSILNVLSLHHVPHRRGDDHRAGVRVPVRALDHRPSAARAGQGPADPQRRPAIPSGDQEGHAHHGRADDPVRHRGVDLAVGQSGQRLCLDRARRDAVLRRRRLL